jgi:hypothetical protein
MTKIETLKKKLPRGYVGILAKKSGYSRPIIERFFKGNFIDKELRITNALNEYVIEIKETKDKTESKIAELTEMI